MTLSAICRPRAMPAPSLMMPPPASSRRRRGPEYRHMFRQQLSREVFTGAAAMPPVSRATIGLLARARGRRTLPTLRSPCARAHTRGHRAEKAASISHAAQPSMPIAIFHAMTWLPRRKALMMPSAPPLAIAARLRRREKGHAACQKRRAANASRAGAMLGFYCRAPIV